MPEMPAAKKRVPWRHPGTLDTRTVSDFEKFSYPKP